MLSASVNLSGSTVEKKSERTAILKPEIAATMLGPQKYIIDNPSPFFCILTGGCAGELGLEQLEVARQMDETLVALAEAQKNDEKGEVHVPAYAHFCGDNFYDDGLNSAKDVKAQTQFYNVYFDPKWIYIRFLMWLQRPGNHDHRVSKPGYHGENLLTAAGDIITATIGETVSKKTKAAVRAVAPSKMGLGEETGEARCKHEIDLTFERLPKEMFLDGKLSPTVHVGWVMTHFYDIFIEDSVTQLGVDSNTILEYYLQYLDELVHDDKVINPLNQFVLMKQEYDDAFEKGQGIIAFQHHPVDSCGKERKEAKFYLDILKVKKLDILLQLDKTDPHYKEKIRTVLAVATEEGLKQLVGFPKPTGDAHDYGHLIRRLYEREGIEPDLIVVAHDHNINYLNTNLDPNAKYKIRQLTTGGAGASRLHLQARHDYKKQPYMGCFLKKNGFSILTCDKKNPKHIFIDIYTTDGLHLRFDNKSHLPIPREPSQDPDVQQAEQLSKVILEACDAYLRQENKPVGYGSSYFFFGKTVYAHTEEQDDCAHYLWAYLSQPTLPDFETICATLEKKIGPLEATKTESTLYQLLNNKIFERFEVDLPELFSLGMTTHKPAA